MFGWIKRLGRKKADIHRSMGAVRVEDVKRRMRMVDLRMAIHEAKRQKKKHSHLAAELARLEQADRSPTHMIQEPGL